MRNLFAKILASIFLLTACSSNSTKVKFSKPQQLFIIVYDISKSVDQYAILKSEHFQKLYSLLGYSGGGKFYGLHIKSYSMKQEPFSATINSIDTLPLKGNRIQVGHIKQKNKALTETFIAGEESFVQNASTGLIKDKAEGFSDIQNALLLSKQILNMPQYTTWEKRILIISDMENDLPPKDGLDPMKPFDFGTSVKVGIVRPSPRISLEKTFPKLTVANYTTIDDGIRSLLTL